jgi:outer membrane protein TolC
MANIGVMVSQEFPHPGKLRLRALIAAKEADAEAQQYRVAALSTVARLKHAYYGLAHGYEIAEVLDRNRDALRSLLRVTEDRYSAGRAAQPDVFRAQTQITLIEARLAQTSSEIRTRSAEINSLLGRPVDSTLGQPESPHDALLEYTREELLAMARDAEPSLAREQKMVERGDAAVHLARKGSSPDHVERRFLHHGHNGRALYAARGRAFAATFTAPRGSRATERRSGRGAALL